MTAVADRIRETVVLHVGNQYRGSEKLVVENALGSRPGVIEVEANPRRAETTAREFFGWGG
jgi:hypothetical protein